MTAGETILSLYSKIPGFECVPGCSECCGPVPCHEWETNRLGIEDAESVMAAALKALTVKDVKKCPLLEGGKCSVYENRPLMCRLFGTVEDLKCPYGKAPEKLLTKSQAAEIMAIYTGLFKKTGGLKNASA